MKDEKLLGADAAAVESAGSIAPDAASHVDREKWEVSPDTDIDGYETGYGRVFALDEFDSPISDYVSIEDAHLIAAAPEMYEALKAHDAYMLDAGYDGHEDDALHPKAAANWKRIRAAVAKAEGKQS